MCTRRSLTGVSVSWQERTVGPWVIFITCVSFNQRSIVNATFSFTRNVVSVFELCSCGAEGETRGPVHIVHPLIFFSSN